MSECPPSRWAAGPSTLPPENLPSCDAFSLEPPARTISAWWRILPPLSRCRETNLKVKQALTVTAGLGGDLQALSSFNGTEGRDAWPAEQPWTSATCLCPCPWSPRGRGRGQLWVRVASLIQFELWCCPTRFSLALPSSQADGP